MTEARFLKFQKHLQPCFFTWRFLKNFLKRVGVHFLILSFTAILPPHINKILFHRQQVFYTAKLIQYGGEFRHLATLPKVLAAVPGAGERIGALRLVPGLAVVFYPQIWIEFNFVEGKVGGAREKDLQVFFIQFHEKLARSVYFTQDFYISVF